MDKIIYKICAAAAWREAERERCFRGAAIDARDGFIHFSTAAQVGETAEKHFAGATDLVPLLPCDADKPACLRDSQRSPCRAIRLPKSRMGPSDETLPAELRNSSCGSRDWR